MFTIGKTRAQTGRLSMSLTDGYVHSRPALIGKTLLKETAGKKPLMERPKKFLQKDNWILMSRRMYHFFKINIPLMRTLQILFNRWIFQESRNWNSTCRYIYGECYFNWKLSSSFSVKRSWNCWYCVHYWRSNPNKYVFSDCIIIVEAEEKKGLFFLGTSTS